MIVAILMAIFQPFWHDVAGIIFLILTLIISMGLTAIFVTKKGLEKIKSVNTSRVALCLYWVSMTYILGWLTNLVNFEFGNLLLLAALYISAFLGILVVNLITFFYPYSTINCLVKYIVMIVIPVSVTIIIYLSIFISGTVDNVASIVIAVVIVLAVGILGFTYVKNLDNVMEAKTWVLCGKPERVLDFNNSIAAVCVLYRDASIFIITLIQILRFLR